MAAVLLPYPLSTSAAATGTVDLTFTLAQMAVTDENGCHFGTSDTSCRFGPSNDYPGLEFRSTEVGRAFGPLPSNLKQSNSGAGEYVSEHIERSRSKNVLGQCSPVIRRPIICLHSAPFRWRHRATPASTHEGFYTVRLRPRSEGSERERHYPPQDPLLSTRQAYPPTPVASSSSARHTRPCCIRLSPRAARAPDIFLSSRC